MLVPFPFKDGIGYKAKRKTRTVCPARALEFQIRESGESVNRVRRIGAFSWGTTKKLPWVKAIAAELVTCLPAKAKTRKEVRSLAVETRAAKNGCRGGITRPSQRLADCRCGYTSFTPRPPIFSGVKLGTTPFGSPRKVGATTDPRHGCSVNTAESVGRLSRFTNHPSRVGVALTGGDALPPAHARTIASPGAPA